MQGEGRPQGAPAQPGLGGRRPPYTARSAVALRAFFPRHRLDEGQRGRKRDGCKKVDSAAVQSTGRSRLLYREEDE